MKVYIFMLSFFIIFNVHADALTWFYSGQSITCPDSWNIQGGPFTTTQEIIDSGLNCSANGGTTQLTCSGKLYSYLRLQCNRVKAWITITCPADTEFNPLTGICESIQPPCVEGETFSGFTNTNNPTCVNGCEVMPDSVALELVSNPGQFFNKFTQTGESCTDGDVPATVENPDPDGCFNVDGQTVCNTADSSCITINGDTLCDDDVRDIPSGCMFLSNNGIVCTETASSTSPPAPDNGTLSVPAVPSFTAQGTAGESLNYFSPQTVSQSTSEPQAAEQPQPGGNFGSGDNTNTGAGSDDFCTVNPDSPICKVSSFGTASCDSQPLCEGDAIQCAIATEIHRIRCQGEDTEDPLFNEQTINDGLGIDTTLEEIGQGTEIDASDPLNGYVPNITASCPADFEAVTSFGTIVIPMQIICDLADFLRPLVLILAFMSASMIYYNGLIREL